jgi:outer membrane protein TolC
MQDLLAVIQALLFKRLLVKMDFHCWGPWLKLVWPICFTGLKAAKSTREFYQINEQLTEEQVIERVANNYYQVYVRRQKNVLDSTYINTNKVKNIIKGRYDNGLSKKLI